MNIDHILSISRYGMETSMFISAPILLMGLAAGIMISIFQAATQINDAALAFIPKMTAVVIAMAVFGHWMITKMMAFAIFTINQIPSVVN